MKREIFLATILMSILTLTTSCEKNPLWVGNKEFIIVEYTNSSMGPEVTENAVDITPFIDFDTTYAWDNGNGSVFVTIDGVRVQSRQNNFEISSISIYEKDDGKFEIQDEFTNLSSSNKTDIAAVLVLDMSTSLGGLVDDLKIYANKFIDQVVSSTDNSMVAVVFFSGKTAIETTAFYNATNADVLKTQINNYTNYDDRTALFQASVDGLSLLDNLNFNGTKALVVFTDGGDNDSNNPSALKNIISSSDYLRISIGLKGADFDKDDLKDIADSNSNAIVVKNEDKLEKAFDTVARQVVSVYRITYERSDQLLDNWIEIKFEVEVDKIK